MPTRTVNLSLPFPPSVNGYWRAFNRGGRCCQIISKRGREYRESVRQHVHNYHRGLTGRLVVEVTLHPPTRRKCDLDNYGKALLDAMEEAGVYDDDNQIDDLRFIRGEIVKGGLAEVVIIEAQTQARGNT